MASRLAALPILAAAFVLEPLLAIAQQAQQTQPPPQAYFPPGHMMWYGYGWPFWWMFPMMMLFVLVVCGAMFFMSWRSGSHGPHHWRPPMMGGMWGEPTHSALQILNERFARGEIQKDEYLEKKTVLLSGGPR